MIGATLYLKNIAIKNIGPIDELSIQLPFNENGNPKPLLLVGENGAGKTMFQSQIIDSLYEIGSNLFHDVGIKGAEGRNYYKVSGAINLQIGKDKGFSLLSFVDSENQKIEYFDKIGNVTKQDFTSAIADYSLSPNGQNGNQKHEIVIHDTIKKENLEKEWIQEVHIFQPAYRYEEPFWKNEIFKDKQRFEDKVNYTGVLGKEIEIISSTKENKAYLMDLVLDFTNNRANTIDQVTWNNINSILRKIKKKDNIRFGIGPRGGYRVSIVEVGESLEPVKTVLPSIDNLSLGESILLNLFINIIRHGDKPPKLTTDIRGIVAIDEIDVHLHTDLQNAVLPELIRLFPKVQFIITTHSPLFILGMKNVLGENNFEIRNMPNGEVITAERFSEFENAYKVLKDTQKYEADMNIKIQELNKPIVFVEGPTDVKYIQKAYQLFAKEKDLQNFDIDIIGEDTGTGTKNSNNFALKNAKNFIKSNIGFVKQKVLLLNDPEENVADETINNLLYVRKMKQYDENPLQHGIENLFHKTFIDQLKEAKKDCFQYQVIGGEEKNLKIVNGKKVEICEWICENAQQEEFENFQYIIDIIEDFLKVQ
ncbi:AAA family ATPase [Sulfurimonas microaerophilic]|uniref:AAA family ATPase n=1 Tax=Sulfurimonas microaerophilic TaxID=3058392 RepID=UPI0027147C00|nr:AAA family ATPase [Sulfurimonas sp. hsl 1-7]